MRKINLTVLSIFTLFLVWILLDIIVDNSLLLPNPLEVLKSLLKIITDSKSLFAIFSTIFRLIISLVIAFFLGFILGVLAGVNEKAAIFMNPMVTVLRTIPVISITVIVLIVLGFELTPYFITFLMLFPLIYQGVYGGIKSIDQELVDVYRLEDNRLFSRIIHCYIPLIRNNIETSILQSLGLGIKVIVMAEYLGQTQNSIGNNLYLAKINIEYSEVFAWTILLIFFALLFEFLISRTRKIIIKK
ncbi:MAG: ABC transporter permease subunit [Candidatus Izemoplasmatales bacterium]